MRTIFILYCFLLSTNAFGAVFYSASGGGDWNDPLSWSSSDGGAGGAGVPGTDDEIIIRNGDLIVLNDNNLYTHNANILIRTGGELRKDGNGYFAFNGLAFEFQIFGTFRTTNTNARLQNYGFIHMHSGATVELGNDYEVFNSSTTIVDNILIINDDLRLNGSGGQLCGSGQIRLGTGNGAIINPDGSDGSTDQICSGICVENDGPAGNTTCGTGSFTLPLTLIEFRIIESQLYWKVIEYQVAAYQIQYSSDIVNWQNIGEVESQGDDIQEYFYPLNKAGYYRIQSVEAEPFTSQVLWFYLESKKRFTVYPNPIYPNEELKTEGFQWKELSVYHANGRFMESRTYPNSPDFSQYSQGYYLLRFQGEVEQKAVWILLR